MSWSQPNTATKTLGSNIDTSFSSGLIRYRDIMGALRGCDTEEEEACQRREELEEACKRLGELLKRHASFSSDGDRVIVVICGVP